MKAQLLKHARTQTKAINRMITDILQAARGSDQKFQIRPIDIDLSHLFVDILDCVDMHNGFNERIFSDPSLGLQSCSESRGLIAHESGECRKEDDPFVYKVLFSTIPFSKLLFL